MKIIKYLFLGLVIVIAIPLVIALFVDSEYKVERQVTINKPLKEVFGYIKYLKNQDSYSKWYTLDPHQKKTYTGTDGTAGFISAWESDSSDVGRGEQEILEVVEGERINYELRFFEPFESTSPAYMTTTQIDSAHTTVTWGFEGKLPYPMNLMLAMQDLEKNIGDDLHYGLKELKNNLEYDK